MRLPERRIQLDRLLQVSHGVRVALFARDNAELQVREWEVRVDLCFFEELGAGLFVTRESFKRKAKVIVSKWEPGLQLQCLVEVSKGGFRMVVFVKSAPKVEVAGRKITL